MKLLCENSQRPKHAYCFCKRAPPHTSNWVLNLDPTRGVLNVGCGWKLITWNLWPQASVQEVFETLSNYKKSYFWWYGNPIYGNSKWNNHTGKDQGCVSARLVWGKRGQWAVWFSGRGAPLDDWANNGGYVDVLFTCGECGFSFFGSWSTHSKFPALFSFRNSARNI